MGGPSPPQQANKKLHCTEGKAEFTISCHTQSLQRMGVTILALVLAPFSDVGRVERLP